MLTLLKTIWQFPQLILGLIFKLVLSIKYNVIKTEKYGISYYSVKGWKNGISLSPYFIRTVKKTQRSLVTEIN